MKTIHTEVCRLSPVTGTLFEIAQLDWPVKEPPVHFQVIGAVFPDCFLTYWGWQLRFIPRDQVDQP